MNGVSLSCHQQTPDSSKPKGREGMSGVSCCGSPLMKLKFHSTNQVPPPARRGLKPAVRAAGSPSPGNPILAASCTRQELERRGEWRWVAVGGAALTVMMVMGMGMGTGMEARALGGPEGPLVEEFWDNVRRYGLYALTVSTGAIYTIAQPIIELLKTPVTAILIIALLVGAFYLVSLVLSAMFGITEYAYQYGY